MGEKLLSLYHSCFDGRLHNFLLLYLHLALDGRLLTGERIRIIHLQRLEAGRTGDAWEIQILYSILFLSYFPLQICIFMRIPCWVRILFVFLSWVEMDKDLLDTDSNSQREQKEINLNQLKLNLHLL